MLLKTKIFFTIFSIYEIIAIMMLHCQRVCDAMFSTTFCDSGYKYFLFCVALPLIVFLIGMWIHEIFVARRRRHSFLYKAKTAAHDMMNNVRDHMSDKVSTANIEKIIAIAVLAGVKKYAQKHPKSRQTLKNILGAISDQGGEYIDSDEDDNNMRPARPKNKNNTKKKR